jgi:hypothetical protein
LYTLVPLTPFILNLILVHTEYILSALALMHGDRLRYMVLVEMHDTSSIHDEMGCEPLRY